MFVIKIHKSVTEKNPETKDWSGPTSDHGVQTVIKSTRSEMIEWLSSTYPIKLENIGNENRWHFDQLEDEDGIKSSTGKYLCDYDIYLYETHKYTGNLNEPIKDLFLKYIGKRGMYMMDSSVSLLNEIIQDLDYLK